jgi:hypothetical protein
MNDTTPTETPQESDDREPTPDEREAWELSESVGEMVSGYEAIFGCTVAELTDIVAWLKCGQLENARFHLEEFRTLVESPLCPVGGVYIYHAIYRVLCQEERWATYDDEPTNTGE